MYRKGVVNPEGLRPITRTFNPGGARWCEDHRRMECTKNRSRGRGSCHALAVRGTDGCQRHVGASLAVAKVKGEARISAWSAVGDVNAAENVTSSMAVLGILQMSWLRLGAYSDLLRRQVVLENGPDTGGLIGHRYGAAGKDGHIFAQSEEVRALVALEASERDRVVKYAEAAHKMGISDRLTALAERWGDVVATRISTMLDELNLSPEQQARVPILVQAHLGTIDVTAMGGEKT